MAQQLIDIGVQGNDGTGDSIRTSFDKVNKNFNEIYAIFGGGGTIPFTQLADAPTTYSANQVIMAATTGGTLTARTIRGTGGITVITSNNSEVVINSDNTGIVAEQAPTLGVSLNANLFSIGRIGNPSQALVDAFNITFPNTPTTLNQLAINKGYADSRYIATDDAGFVDGALKVRSEPLVPQTGIVGYDASLTSNYLSTEAMQRKDTVYRGGDTMTGALTLHDHPSPMSGQGTPSSADDLQAATKFYVDNNTYYSGVNLYVSATKGDDLQSKTPAGREGRAWQYAYKTVGAAALQAENLINLSNTEPGPYRQTITYTTGPTQYKSTVQTVTLSGGNTLASIGNNGYEDAAALLRSNKEFIQYETIAYLNKKYVNAFTIDQTYWKDIIGRIVDGIGYDLVLSKADGTVLTNYNSVTQATILYNSYNTNIITNQLSQLIDGINYAKQQILDFSYDTTDLQTYVGSLIDALTYDLVFGGNYQSVQTALAFPSAGTDLSNEEMIKLLDYSEIQIVSLVANGNDITFTFASQENVPYKVGSSIIIKGMVPIGYNGTFTVVAVSNQSVTVTNSYITSLTSASFTGRIDNGSIGQSGTRLTVSGSVTGTITVGMQISGGNIPVGTYIISQFSGTPGSVGVYILSSSLSQSLVSIVGVSNAIVTPGSIVNSNIINNILQANGVSDNPTAVTSLKNNASVISDFLTNGEIPEFDIPTQTANTDGQKSATSLLLSNIAFIQAELISHITENYPNLLYNRVNFRKDVEYIVYSLVYDLLYGGNSQSVYTGRSYRIGGVLRLTTAEQPAWASAVGYFKDKLLPFIISNTAPVTLSQQTVAQYTNETLTGGSASASSLTTNLNSIQRIIDGTILSPTVTLPTVSTTSSTLQTLRTNIRANTNALKSIAVAYVNATFPVINDQAGYPISTTVTSLFSSITNMLTLGVSTRPAVVLNRPAGLTDGYWYAKDAIFNNLDFITAETLAWMKTNAVTIGYTSTTEGDAKSIRDIKYLLEAICYDIVYGGNSATIKAAKQYWANSTSQIVGLNGLTQACYRAVNQAQTITKAVAANITYAPVLQSPVTYPQVNNPVWAAGSATTTFLDLRFNEIKDIMANNTVYTPVYPELTSYDSVVISASAIIRNYSEAIKKETVDYLVSKFTGNFTYNESTCFRDIGYIVDGAAIDLLTGGNYQSVNAGKSYYRNVSAQSIAIGTQLTETVDGIEFARSLGQQVLNKSVANRYQVLYLQDLDVSKSPSTAAKNTFTSNYNIILDIIKGGYGIAPTASFGTGIYSVTFNNGGNGFVDQGGNITIGAQSSIHIIPGKILTGNVSNAYGQIVSYSSGFDNGNANDTITVRLTQPGFFTVGETLDFGETVNDLNITIYAESGIYYEDYPIKLSANVTLSGDDFRRTIIRPLNRISQSPWRNTFFYRDAIIDGIQTGLIDFTTDYASVANTSATISGISGNITITLSSNVQALASWVGKVFMDADAETGTAGKAIVNTVSGNVMNCTVIYPFASATTYTTGNWHLYGTYNYGRHYLTNPILTEGTIQASFLGSIVGDQLTVTNLSGTITIGQLVYGTGVIDGTKIIRGSGLTWTVNFSHANSVSSSMTVVNTAKNNKELDVFLVNDAIRIKLITAQGHGGFMMVLDPTGQIKTKSPYCQESASFSGSLGSAKRFAGGQFIDGFAGRLFGTVTNIADTGRTITVTGSTNSGLNLRAPQVPCAFYVAGFRYQINDVVNWNPSGNGAVTLTLDKSTPFNLSNAYNTNTSLFVNRLGYVVDAANLDMVLGSNYKSTVAGLTYLQPTNALTSIGALLTKQGIAYANTQIQAASITSGNKTSFATNLALVSSIISNSTEALPVNNSSTWSSIFGSSWDNGTNASKAAKIIQTNKEFIKSEIAAWISGNFNTQGIAGYSAVKSQRDTGYILDAITFDMLYGGNASVWDQALSYYYASSTTGATFTGTISGTTLNVSSITGAIAIGQTVTGAGVTTNTVITGGSGTTWTVNFASTAGPISMSSASTSSYVTQPVVCAAAMVRLSTVIQQCILNSSITISAGNQLTQDTSLPAATSTEQTITNSLIGVLVDYIADGRMDNDIIAPLMTSGSTTVVVSNNVALVNGATISGTGIPASTTISGTPVLGTGTALGTCTVTLSNAITATNTNVILVVGGSAQTRSTPTISGFGSYANWTTVNSSINTIKTDTISYLNTGAGVGINIEMGGNKSMLANDFTQVNDLGYGILCTNAGLTEQVSTFTYYCHTGYWALNGAQVRSVAGSNANGTYGLRATGFDVTELPDSVNLTYNLVQSAIVYKQGSYATAMTPTATAQALRVYIIGYEYIPTNTSELEIDHTASGGGIVRYEISTITHTPVTIKNQNVLELQLSTTGGSGTSTTGLATALYDGQSVTIRVLQNFKFQNIDNVKPVRPSTALQFVTNLGDIYRIINYTLIESTGEPFAQNSGISILRTDSSFAYYKIITDTTYLGAGDPTTNITAVVAYGGAGNSTSSTTLTVRQVVGTIAAGQIIGGTGFNGQTVVSVTANTATMSSSSIAASTGILTVGTVSGTITVGMGITGGSIAAGTYITALISGSGNGSTWQTSTTTAQSSTTITGTTSTIVTSAVPTLAPVGPMFFATRTQGKVAGDSKIAVTGLTNSATINQLNKGLYVLGWNGRTHRITGYTDAQNIATGAYDGTSSGTTLKLTAVSGTIVQGRLVTGTGFDGTHYVQSVTSVTAGGTTTATVILNKAPLGLPSGTITFGSYANAYVSIDPNPVYNNSAIGTGVSALTFAGQRLLTGSTTQKIVKFTVPYNANTTTNYPVLPPVDSTLTITGNTNTNYNGNYQVVGSVNSTQITLSGTTNGDGSINNTAKLAVGMVVSSSSSGTVIPTSTVIQSIDSLLTFTVSPACWVPSGAVINSIAVATVDSLSSSSNLGSGYLTGFPPTVVLTDTGTAPGRQALFTATVNNDGSINVNKVDPGYGYSSAPTVSFVGGSGSVTQSVTAILSQPNNQTTTSTGGVSTLKLDLLYPTDPGTAGTITATATPSTITLSTSSNITVGNPITFGGTTFGGVSGATVTSGAFTIGQSYTIVSLGVDSNTTAVTDFTAIGAAQNAVGIVFRATGAGTGNGTALTTYYIKSVSSSDITLSAYFGGPTLTSITTDTGSMTFYSPSFTLGTGITISSYTSKSGTSPCLVTFAIPSSSITNGAYYVVSGNSNPLYNGAFACTSATSGSATSIQLSYPFDPGTYGSGTTTITKETTTGTSSGLGISKSFPTSGSVVLRAGYPAGQAGQITIRISTCRATGHDFLDIGTGGFNTTNYPNQIYGNATIPSNSANQTVEETVGRVFHVSTDENGIFKVGRFFQVDQGTGTVTFSASIALSNLDGLGFKRGVVVTQFSTDATMTENAPDIVPVQSAVRGFVDLRLGLDYGGNPVPTNTLIGPGYMPLNGALAMKSNLNIGNNYISNLYMPTSSTSPYDGVNRLYVDNSVAGTNSIAKLKDVSILATGTFVSLSGVTLTVSGLFGSLMPGQRVVNLATATSCTITGTTLTVSGIVTGIFSVGMTIAGPGVRAGTTITSLGTGTGGAGNYAVSGAAQTVPLGVPITGTSTTLFPGQTVSSFTISGSNAVITLSSAPGTSPSSQITIGFSSSVAGDVLTYDSVSASWKNASLPTSSTGNDVTITYVPDTGTGGSFTTAIQNDKIVNAMVSTSAAIVQSKLSMTAATTRANATGIAQANLGLVSMDSAYFTATNGWMTITSSSATTNGIGYDRIRYVSSGAILGNLGNNANTIQELTPGAVVTAGDGIKNASFGTTSSNGAMIHAWANDVHSYSITAITTSSAASSLVKTGTDKSITADSLKIGSATALSIDGTLTTQINLSTPGGVNFLTASGSTGSNAVTTLTGTFNAANGNIEVVDIKTSATDIATVGQISGDWRVQANSIWDVTLGTLKSDTLTTGSNATAGDLTGNWSLTSGSVFNTKIGTLRSKTLDAGNVSTTYTASGSSGTTLKVASSTGIVPGMFVRGVGFTAGQTVVSVALDSVTVTLDAAPDVAPLAVPVGGQALTFITPGTINGAWTLNGTLTLGDITDLTMGTGTFKVGAGTIDISNNSALLKVRHISTGAAATTGDFVGTWTVAAGSTLVATSIVSQANSATITASSANTASQIVQRDGDGNFVAGTMTGIATKANNLTGGNATTLLGSIPYQSAADTTTLLAPNISVVKKYLTMQGNDTNGAAPQWTALGAIDAQQSPNFVFAGPASGTATVVPGFRALVSADIPNHSSTAGGLSGTPSITVATVTANSLAAIAGGSTVTGSWTLNAGAKFEATYADLAEYYEGDQEYEPGTVLVFGGDKEVTTTTQLNDTRSAGVVTTDPAYVMNAKQTGIKVCIALAGRVPVKVVGRVKKGDMLTTAATAGYAVKALTPTLGAIIGKALEDKDYGEAGVIQVAVGRV